MRRPLKPQKVSRFVRGACARRSVAPAAPHLPPAPPSAARCGVPCCASTSCVNACSRAVNEVRWHLCTAARVATCGFPLPSRPRAARHQFPFRSTCSLVATPVAMGFDAVGTHGASPDGLILPNPVEGSNLPSPSPRHGMAIAFVWKRSLHSFVLRSEDGSTAMLT